MGLSAGCGTDGNLSEEMFHLDQPGKEKPADGCGAVRLKYICDMKIRVVGYKAYCQGRAIGDPGSVLCGMGRRKSFKQVIIYQNDYG